MRKTYLFTMLTRPMEPTTEDDRCERPEKIRITSHSPVAARREALKAAWFNRRLVSRFLDVSVKEPG